MPEQEYITNPEDMQINEREEIRQILGRPPGRILRWGISWISLVIIGLFVLARVVKYPDTVGSSVIITTERPPIRVFALEAGKLDELLVREGDVVDANALLAVIENTANRADIQRLLTILKSQPQNFADWHTSDLPDRLELGSMQEGYAAFVKKFETYRYERRQNLLQRQLKSLKQQIKELKSLNETLGVQKSTMKQVMDLKWKNFQRNKELADSDIGTKVEEEEAETVYLQSKRDLEMLETSIINNRIKINELEMSSVKLTQTLKDKLKHYTFELREEADRLQSDLQAWKQRYLIKAPISGVISLSEYWSAQQFVTPEKELLTVVPQKGSGKPIAKGYLPGHRSGKVEIEMPVNIRLNGYPYQEFGVIQTSIKSIAPVPEEDNYLIYLNLPEELITTYGREIPFRQEMKGIGLIITEDRSIMERLLDRIISVFKN